MSRLAKTAYNMGERSTPEGLVACDVPEPFGIDSVYHIGKNRAELCVGRKIERGVVSVLIARADALVYC